MAREALRRQPAGLGAVADPLLKLGERPVVATAGGILPGQAIRLGKNAGVGNPEETVAETSTDEFVRVMVTNALAPLRVVEALQDVVEPTGTIGVMSSGQGSVANNERGGHEVYRGSKAALNTFMRSYAARHRDGKRNLVLMAPGWVKTDLGGPNARLSIEDSIPNVVKTLDSLRDKPGLRYVDYLGRTVPW